MKRIYVDRHCFNSLNSDPRCIFQKYIIAAFQERYTHIAGVVRGFSTVPSYPVAGLWFRSIWSAIRSTKNHVVVFVLLYLY